MKKSFFFILFSIVSAYTFSQTIILNGTYQGENLIVSNPFASTGLGFCIYEVIVNGEFSTDEINSSSFEIDLSSYNLNVGDKVEITIKHKEGCSPKVVNSKVLQPRSTFETVSINLDLQGNLEWKTKNESGKLDFIIEQFRWNKWVKIGVISGLGMRELNQYTKQIELHSGTNRVRAKQVDYTRHPHYTKEVTIENSVDQVTFKKKGGKITFSRATLYEIYDAYGQRKLAGYSQEVDISKLSKGNYYLNYDNVMGDFSK